MYRIGEVYLFTSRDKVFNNTKHKVLSTGGNIIYMGDLQTGVINSWHIDYLTWSFKPKLYNTNKKSPLPGWW